MRYDSYLNAIESFVRDDVLTQASFLAWKAWAHDEKVPEHEKMNHLFVKAYTPRVFAISAAIGHRFARRQPAGEDVLNLCKGFIEVDDTVSDQSFVAQEKEETIRLARAAKTLGKYKLDESALRFVSLTSFLQRLMCSQWSSQAYGLGHVFRRSLIYRELLKLKPRLSLEIHLREGLRQEEDAALRAGIALFTMLRMKDKPDFGWAFLNVNSSTIQSEISEKYGITHETLKLMAANLTTTFDEMQEWHLESQKVHELYRKYYPLPFYARPFLDAHDISGPFVRKPSDTFIVCPSPELLLAGMSTLFVELLSKKSDRVKGILSFLGDAAEEYLATILPSFFEPSRITRLEKDPHRKTADFIIELDEAFLVVECKRSVNNRLGRTMFTPSTQVKVWEKLTDALEQCSSTIKSHSSLSNPIKPIICLIVADDDVLTEDGTFAIVVEASGVLKELGIQHFELVSLDVFERLFGQRDHSEIVRLSLEKWARFREHPNISTFHSLNFSKFKSFRPYNFPHLGQAFDKLLPESANPFGSVL